MKREGVRTIRGEVVTLERKKEMIKIIEWIHNKGMIHCDIKMDNLMIDEKEKVVLIDYGLARPYIDMKTGEHIPNTKNNTPIGTREYMSIYVKEGNRPSRRDDMISLAKVMVAMGEKEDGYMLEIQNLKYEERPKYERFL